MSKKRMCIILALILFVVFQFFYWRPQSVKLEMTMCSWDGETIQFVLSGTWYRQFGGKQLLMGDVWVDGVVYHSVRRGSYNWKDQKGKKIFMPFISEYQKRTGFPFDEVQVEFLGEEAYIVWVSLQEGSTTYYGPAASKEECELLIQKYYFDN